MSLSEGTEFGQQFTSHSRREAALRFLMALITVFYVTQPVVGADKTPADSETIDFVRDIAPILKRNCVECHGSQLQMAELRLDSREAVLIDGSERDLIKPGHSEDSLLIQRLTDPSLGIIMPPFFQFFPSDEIGIPDSELQLLKGWIDAGATWPEGIVLSDESTKQSESAPHAALLAAIRAGQHEAVQKLLGDIQLVDAVDRDQATPLMHAILYSDAAMMNLVIERGANVNAVDAVGITPLMLAAGNPEKTRILLDNDAAPNALSHRGRSALLIAASYPDNLQTVELLLSHGANAAVRDDIGESVLTAASRRGTQKMLEALIAAGADSDGGGGFLGQTPLAWAAYEMNEPAVECLLNHGAGNDKDSLNAALFNASVFGPVSSVRRLLEHGANPNTPAGWGGYNSLQGAVYSENADIETVRLLLKHGGDVNLKAATAETALVLARRRGSTLIVKLLEESGATQ